MMLFFVILVVLALHVSGSPVNARDLPYLPDAELDTQGEQQYPEAGDHSSEQHLPDSERPDQEPESLPAGPRGLEPSISPEETVSADEKAIRESERAEEDLNAQQNMAAAAWAMVLVAFVQTLVTAAGVWLVWKTIRSTREAFVEERRAWLKITKVIFRPVDIHALQRGDIIIEVEYENVGVTPALSSIADFRIHPGVNSPEKAMPIYSEGGAIYHGTPEAHALTWGSATGCTAVAVY